MAEIIDTSSHNQPSNNDQFNFGSSGENGYFSHSSRNIRVDDNRFLRAECLLPGGDDWQDSELDLDTCLTNTNGQFEWQVSGDFSQSANNVRAEGPVLVADLQDGDGRWNRDVTVNLDLWIANMDGNLTYIRYNH